MDDFAAERYTVALLDALPVYLRRFLAADAANEQYFGPSRREGHAMFDLPAYIVARLEGAGIGEVGNLGLCTYGNEDSFFSYRRTTHRGEADYGRQVSAISLTR